MLIVSCIHACDTPVGYLSYSLPMHPYLYLLNFFWFSASLAELSKTLRVALARAERCQALTVLAISLSGN